jgi:hypothetical protein
VVFGSPRLEDFFDHRGSLTWTINSTRRTGLVWSTNSSDPSYHSIITRSKQVLKQVLRHRPLPQSLNREGLFSYSPTDCGSVGPSHPLLNQSPSKNLCHHGHLVVVERSCCRVCPFKLTCRQEPFSPTNQWMMVKRMVCSASKRWRVIV